MPNVKINNKKYEIEKGRNLYEFMKENIGNYKDFIATKVNGKLKDLTTTTVTDEKDIELLKFEDVKEVFWHSSAHLMAYAIKRLYPNTKLAIGPAIDNGFYYDLKSKKRFNKDDFKEIEKEMKAIVKSKEDFKRREVSYDKAKEMFENNEFKLELIKEYKDEKLSIYSLGDFVDLCKGPHVPNSSYIKAFKLTKISGAYWKGDSENEQLQRIYGISFPTKKELRKYIHQRKEAEKRDHRKIGKELNLFSFHEEAPGMPFFHDKGRILWDKLKTFMVELMEERDYQINKTPIILNKDLWHRSGHWDHYKENMYFTKIDDDDYAVKPMNCPGNILVFKNNPHSYRDLPIRAGEFGLVHRHELSGVLSGLFRVRCFTQDDAHVFCTKKQIKDELKALLELIDVTYSTFDFDYNIELSTRPEKSTGNDELWELAEGKLKELLDEEGYDYKINEGDGAFYGPKIDFQLKDALNRSWQCGTVQLDFQMPERFDLEYKGSDGEKHRPVMIHRAIYGSLERFLGILIEHYAGKFPVWLNPTQVKILPITDRNNEYCEEIKSDLEKEGIRVELNNKSETLSKKIRNAEKQKVNYIIVVGDREEKNNKINVRHRDSGDQESMELSEFKKMIKSEIKNKK